MKKTIVAGFCIMSALTLASCSSSGPSLESMNDLPSMDASHYDYSQSSSSQSRLKISSRALGGVGEVGGFSRAACESYTLKKQLFQDSRQIDSFLCYIKTMETEAGMTVPKDDFAYYQIHFPEKPDDQEGGPPEHVRVRIGLFNGQLKMDACTPMNDVYSHEVEVRFSATSSGYSGYVVNEYSFTNPTDEKTYTGNSKIEVGITGTSVDDYSEASFTAYHLDNDGSGNGWQSQMAFVADAAAKTNTLSGANAYSSTDWGSNTGRLYGQWGDDLIGSVQFGITGEYAPPSTDDCLAWGVPSDAVSFCANKCYRDGQEVAPNGSGNCTFENSGTQSFSIDMSESTPSFSIVANSSSPYYDAVSAMTMPTLDDLESKVAFIEDWDCTSAGGFIDVDATALTTIADTCEPTRDDDIWRLCEEQQRAAETQ